MSKGKIEQLMSMSPHIELMVRRIYRSHIFHKFLSKKVKKKTPTDESFKKADFSKVIEYLKDIGVKKGDILIVHSAYDPLKKTGLKPKEIIDELLKLVSDEGTLVMPVIRKYKESPKDPLKDSIEHIVFKYNIRKTRVWTGIIPIDLMRRKGAVISRTPINTLAAIGKESNVMFEKELEEEIPAPNGKNSAWNYCLNKNAWNVSIGVDLPHSITMIHTAEDIKKEEWPVKNWYRKKKFLIVSKEETIEKTFLERKPKWGMLHFCERTLRKDMVNEEIMKSNIIDEILVESARSKPLIDFLNTKNKNGYPYFWVKKHLK